MDETQLLARYQVVGSKAWDGRSHVLFVSDDPALANYERGLIIRRGGKAFVVDTMPETER